MLIEKNDEEIKKSMFYFDNSFPTYELANNLKMFIIIKYLTKLKILSIKSIQKDKKTELCITKNKINLSINI